MTAHMNLFISITDLTTVGIGGLEVGGGGGLVQRSAHQNIVSGERGWY